MEFNYLDSESEKELCTLLSLHTIQGEQRAGRVIENLINNGYVKGLACTSLSDLEPRFTLTGITQKGASYFELKNKYIKESKKLSRKDWWIAIVSAIIGALIGLIPSFIQWFK